MNNPIDSFSLAYLVTFLWLFQDYCMIVTQIFSSYKEYIGKVATDDKICNFNKILDMKPGEYGEFVNDRISYQRELAKVRKLLFLEPTTTPEVG